MADDAEEPAMLWSMASLAHIDNAVYDMGLRVRARALDIARCDGRTLVGREDAVRAFQEVICESEYVKMAASQTVKWPKVTEVIQ